MHPFRKIHLAVRSRLRSSSSGRPNFPAHVTGLGISDLAVSVPRVNRKFFGIDFVGSRVPIHLQAATIRLRRRIPHERRLYARGSIFEPIKSDPADISSDDRWDCRGSGVRANALCYTWAIGIKMNCPRRLPIGQISWCGANYASHQRQGSPTSRRSADHAARLHSRND